MQGTVKFFNDTKGFGFITPDGGGNDAFVHVTALEASGLKTLREGRQLSYDLAPDRRGRESATNVQALYAQRRWPDLCEGRASAEDPKMQSNATKFYQDQAAQARAKCESEKLANVRDNLNRCADA